MPYGPPHTPPHTPPTVTKPSQHHLVNHLVISSRSSTLSRAVQGLRSFLTPVYKPQGEGKEAPLVLPSLMEHAVLLTVAHCLRRTSCVDHTLFVFGLVQLRACAPQDLRSSHSRAGYQQWVLSLRVDYNHLESSFLVTAVGVLIAGMVFASRGFNPNTVRGRVVSVLLSALPLLGVT